MPRLRSRVRAPFSALTMNDSPLWLSFGVCVGRPFATRDLNPPPRGRRPQPVTSCEDSWGIGQLCGGIEWILATSALPGGVEQLWGGIANFLAVIFLLAAASRAALFALGSSFLAVVAFAAGNALLLSAGCSIRYRRGPPTVRNTHSVLKKASCGTRRIFGSPPCSKQASTVRKGYSVPETPFYGTRQNS